MKKSCIICGQPTGSREHIFPAALGGRRTNKGIYCGIHNNKYSPLAGILSEQFRFFNALLGVQGDHSDDPHTTVTADDASGLLVKMSKDKIEFLEPQVIAQSIEGNTQNTSLRFTSQRQKQEWVDAQKALGKKLALGAEVPGQSYFLTESTFRLNLGGPDGLRGIGYVALTFLAHHFPEIARRQEMNQFKAYTLGAPRNGEVWWDWELTDEAPNAFEFGHRIVIGIDAKNAVAYARISFFSALHFDVLFGPTAASESQTIIIDIDPLAAHPPNDIHEKWESMSSRIAQRAPQPAVTHSDAIGTGIAQKSVGILLERISRHQLSETVDAMMAKIEIAESMDNLGRKVFFAKLVAPFSQRILNLMRHVATTFKAAHPEQPEVSACLDLLVAPDPSAMNGLSIAASASLAIACNAIASQMLDDYAQGGLTKDRAIELLNGGPGAAIVGKWMMEPIFRSLKA
jgi:hypothetical protein